MLSETEYRVRALLVVANVIAWTVFVLAQGG